MSHPKQTIEETKQELKRLVQEYVYKKLDKPVQLASGAITTEYFDAKQITLIPDRAVLFARLILEEADLDAVDAVGGMSIGADPIVTAVSLIAYLEKGKHIPGFFVRKEAKKHGLQKNIEGIELKKGMRILIVEDVITQGSATLKAIDAVESLGAKVRQVICLIDREAGGAAEISARHKFYAIFKKSEL